MSASSTSSKGDAERPPRLPPRLGRRRALVGFGAAATTAAAGLSGLESAAAQPAADQASARDDEAVDRPDAYEPLERPDAVAAHGLSEPSDEVRRLFEGLSPGTPLEDHWRIVRVYGVRAGAIPVVLSPSRATGEATPFVVEIFRVDPEGARPIAAAGSLALHLSNRGHGDRATDELRGLGVQALARALDRRLEAGARPPEELLTHAQRRARNPGGVFHVPTR